jgi:hypothetical protein
MSTEETAEVLRRFNQAFADNNPSALEDLVAPDCVMESIQPAPNGTRYEGYEVNLKFWPLARSGLARRQLAGADALWSQARTPCHPTAGDEGRS